MAEPISVLRVIARLNVGGPAMHVSYLRPGSTRSATRRRSRRAGWLGRGFDGAVAEERGVHPVYISGLQRDIAPCRRCGVERLLA